jgi:hypothetical protein
LLQFGVQVGVIEKILQHRRVKIGLQDAVGAIHRAESPDMHNLVTTAGVVSGPGACPDEGPFVAGQIQHLLAPAHRVLRGSHIRVYFIGVRHRFDRHFEPAADGPGLRPVGYLGIDVKRSNPHGTDVSPNRLPLPVSRVLKSG